MSVVIVAIISVCGEAGDSMLAMNQAVLLFWLEKAVAGPFPRPRYLLGGRELLGKERYPRYLQGKRHWTSLTGVEAGNGGGGTGHQTPAKLNEWMDVGSPDCLPAYTYTHTRTAVGATGHL